jgi:small conductance mechanosensitive channel
MDDWWRQFPGLAVTYGSNVLAAILIVGVGWLAIRFVVSPLRGLLSRSRVDPSAASFLVNCARSVIWVVVVLGVLRQLGVETASLLTLVGAAGLAVALSLQGSLANFAAGILLLSFRLVRVGDLVETGDFRGQVTEILPFHVILTTLDNQRVTVPNTLLTNTPFRNHSALPRRRVQWTLPVGRQDDVAVVKEALRSRLAADPRILGDPVPQLYFQDWTDEKRLLVVTAWTATEDALAVQQDLLEVLGSALDAVRGQPAEGGPPA